ncbi:MAG: hypothetical protein RML94_10685 [Bacteroidia bacterium]|nr:hypothetical protein [Bacteroidia bacterium]
MRRASREAWCEAPLAHVQTLTQGVGGWGAAPLARSTPTRSASEGTRPKKYKNQV